MAALSNKLTLLAKDNAGNIAKFAILVAAAVVDPSAGGVATFRAAIAAMSKAYTYAASLSFYAIYSDTAAAGSFSDNEDKALMTFLDEDGGFHNFLVPSPAETVFDASGDKIDGTDAAVLAYVGAVTGTCVTKAGRAITTFVRGRRIRKDRKGR